jgi:beta-lactam-binding protein with PASTA domain
MANLPFVEFTTPSSAITTGKQANMVNVPSVKCKSLSEAKKALTKSGFDPIEGDQVVSDCPAGTAAGTDPTGKTVKGGSVTILISKGPTNGTNPTRERR